MASRLDGRTRLIRGSDKDTAADDHMRFNLLMERNREAHSKYSYFKSIQIINNPIKKASFKLGDSLTRSFETKSEEWRIINKDKSIFETFGQQLN